MAEVKAPGNVTIIADKMIGLRHKQKQVVPYSSNVYGGVWILPNVYWQGGTHFVIDRSFKGAYVYTPSPDEYCNSSYTFYWDGIWPRINHWYVMNE